MLCSSPVAALEATQGQNNSFFSQLPYKCYLEEVACYLEEVASVGDYLRFAPGLPPGWFGERGGWARSINGRMLTYSGVQPCSVIWRRKGSAFGGGWEYQKLYADPLWRKVYADLLSEYQKGHADLLFAVSVIWRGKVLARPGIFYQRVYADLLWRATLHHHHHHHHHHH